MNGLRELALAKLAAKRAEAGQRAGQEAGQGVSHCPEIHEGPWDSKNGGNLPETSKCPAVPLSRGRDSGTAGPKPGQRAGQEAGQQAGIDDRLAVARLREWHAHLSRLDVYTIPAGLTDKRDWWTRFEDAWFIYEHFASRAVRDGWSAADLFGVLPVKWGWGGLCDRLRGASDLKMTADTAAWTVFGVRMTFSRGSGDDLVAAGLVPIWEVE